MFPINSMKVWSLTDVGLVRKENQDAYAAEFLEGHTVCVVCDGMGGVSGGLEASHIAVKTFMTEVKKVLVPEMLPEQLREVSSYAAALANKAIREAASQSVERQNMGTTLVSAISYSDGVVITNVGDSRAYHISQNGIVQITKDHSLVESLVDRGDITAEEARHHPKRNLITRALGPDVTANCDGYICPMSTGEYLLLCTDGLVDTVTDQEIFSEVLHGGDLQDGEMDDCLKRLLEISKSRGASDNITAVLMRQP